MNTNVQILPGIRFIGYFDISKLPDQPRLDLAGVCGMTVGLMAEVTPIDFCDEPECRRTTERVNGQRQDKVSLKFLSHSLIPYTSPLGFVVTDQQGNTYAIGCQSLLPETKVDMLLGAPDGDGSGFYYEVSHEAIASLVKCHALI